MMTKISSQQQALLRVFRQEVSRLQAWQDGFNFGKKRNIEISSGGIEAYPQYAGRKLYPKIHFGEEKIMSPLYGLGTGPTFTTMSIPEPVGDITDSTDADEVVSVYEWAMFYVVSNANLIANNVGLAVASKATATDLGSETSSPSGSDPVVKEGLGENMQKKWDKDEEEETFFIHVMRAFIAGHDNVSIDQIDEFYLRRKEREGDARDEALGVENGFRRVELPRRFNLI